MAENRKQATNEKEKVRGPNLTIQEKTLMLSCIEDWKKIIENPSTSAVSSRAKSKAWDQVAADYAELAPKQGITVSRTAQQIQAYWKGEKAKSRVIDSAMKKHPKGTGGGEPLQLDATSSCLNSLVHSIQPTLDFTLENKFDSTAEFEAEYTNEQNDEPYHELESDPEVPAEPSTMHDQKVHGKVNVEAIVDLTTTSYEKNSLADTSIMHFKKEDTAALDSDKVIIRDESDEEDLSDLEKELTEKARLKRILERTTIRENLLNELKEEEQKTRQNKKDRKPSKQQRKAQIKSYGNPKLKVEAVQRFAGRAKAVGNSAKKGTVGRVTNKLAASLRTFEAMSRSTGEDQLSSPSKILAERASSSQDNYSSDIESPTKTPPREKKSPGPLEKRLRKCQENCDPGQDLFAKRMKISSAASNSEQNERLRRIEESRRQQQEIHQENMEILQKQKRYWDIKVETATLEKENELSKCSKLDSNESS